MPNHITSVLTVTGNPERVAAFRAQHILLEDGQSTLDFGTIIPMPQCVIDTKRGFSPGDFVDDATVDLYAQALIGDRRHALMDRYAWIPAHVRSQGEFITWCDKEYSTANKWARAQLRCAAETGYPGWYDWSIANWGTKWNAYDYKERLFDNNRFVSEFQTAWSVPQPILEKLADLWPDLTLDIEAIDEGGGEFVGHYQGLTHQFSEVEDDAERYKRVYGHPRHED